jgi:hypothetical protein
MTEEDLTYLRKVLTGDDASTGAVAPVTLDDKAAGKLLELVYAHQRFLSWRILQTKTQGERMALLASIGVRNPPVATDALFKAGQAVRHAKSGCVYDIVYTPSQVVIERTWEPAYAYMANGVMCIRPQTEMEDGRFEKV